MTINETLKNTCKIGQGSDCCKYLGSDADGFSCLKLSYLKSTIDARTDMSAKSDNCEGKIKFEYYSKNTSSTGSLRG